MGIFYLVGGDLLKVMEESRRTCFIPGDLNVTYIDLIPKSVHPKTFKEFIPTSLCNVLYKLIVKIISNRLKPFLSSGISKEKFVFLYNRHILDAIGFAQEVLHSVKTKNLPGLVLKLGLEKAYDRVNWSFLRFVLLQIGLNLPTTNWIMTCVSLANFVVLVNGSPSEFFKASKGVKQGCPLSCYLLLLVIEGLGRMVLRYKNLGLIQHIKVTSKSNLTHLLFV